MSSSLISQPSSKKKILVVDDSADNLLLIESILQSEEHEIVSAKDGMSALRLVKQFSSQLKLILLDVMMPEMDGFEVTRRIRQEQIPFIPILLITAYDQPSAVKGLDSGADDFIRKPMDVDELLARVRSLLRLKHSVDQTELMALQREDFVSRLTHDLRTPLVAADRMLILIAQGALGEISADLLEAINTMERSNRNLLELVNTLLEVYRYEAERKRFNFSKVGLPPLVAEVIQELRPLAQAKELTLNFEVEAEADKIRVKGDRLELRRLITNIIGNAIKFTDSGSVDVRLAQVDSTDWWTFSVQDTGPGIAPEEQQWLFDRFCTGSHRGSGSGLGLHLSRQIVEAHGGTIKLQSEVGKGSLFIVRLPGWLETEQK